MPVHVYRRCFPYQPVCRLRLETRVILRIIRHALFEKRFRIKEVNLFSLRHTDFGVLSQVHIQNRGTTFLRPTNHKINQSMITAHKPITFLEREPPGNRTQHDAGPLTSTLPKGLFLCILLCMHSIQALKQSRGYYHLSRLVFTVDDLQDLLAKRIQTHKALSRISPTWARDSIVTGNERKQKHFFPTWSSGVVAR